MWFILLALKTSNYCKNVGWQTENVLEESQKRSWLGMYFLLIKDWRTGYDLLFVEMFVKLPTLPSVSVYAFRKRIMWTSSTRRRVVSHLFASSLLTSQLHPPSQETIQSLQEQPCISEEQLCDISRSLGLVLPLFGENWLFCNARKEWTTMIYPGFEETELP